MAALVHVHIITFAEFVLQDCHKETVSTRVGLTRPVTFKRESSFTVRSKSSALWRYTAYTDVYVRVGGIFFTARRYASAVFAIVMCLSVSTG